MVALNNSEHTLYLLAVRFTMFPPDRASSWKRSVRVIVHATRPVVPSAACQERRLEISGPVRTSVKPQASCGEEAW